MTIPVLAPQQAKRRSANGSAFVIEGLRILGHRQNIGRRRGDKDRYP